MYMYIYVIMYINAVYIQNDLNHKLVHVFMADTIDPSFHFHNQQSTKTQVTVSCPSPVLIHQTSQVPCTDTPPFPIVKLYSFHYSSKHVLVKHFSFLWLSYA